MGVFRIKLPGGAQNSYTIQKIFIRYHEQKFCIKFAFSVQHWTGLSIEKYKTSVFGVLIKVLISVLNFSTESA